MTAVAHKRFYTEEEYLERENAAPDKSEYHNGEIFPMSGALYAHSKIKDNISGFCRSIFTDGRCAALTSDVRVYIRTCGLYTYPDALIVCGKPLFHRSDMRNLTNPQAIFEVLSESTRAYDTGAKFKMYRGLESLREYILVEQTHACVQVHTKQPDGRWLMGEFEGMEATVRLEAVGIDLPMAEIYRFVEFEPAPSIQRPDADEA